MTSNKVPAFNDWPNDIGVSLLSHSEFLHVMWLTKPQFTTHEEQSEPVDLEVIGTIPAYVS